MRVLWVLLGEWEATQRGAEVGNGGGEHGALQFDVLYGRAQGNMGSAWLASGCSEGHEATPLTRQCRVRGESELDSHTIDHDVSWMSGKERT